MHSESPQHALSTKLEASSSIINFIDPSRTMNKNVNLKASPIRCIFWVEHNSINRGNLHSLYYFKTNPVTRVQKFRHHIFFIFISCALQHAFVEEIPGAWLGPHHFGVLLDRVSSRLARLPSFLNPLLARITFSKEAAFRCNPRFGVRRTLRQPKANLFLAASTPTSRLLISIRRAISCRPPTLFTALSHAWGSMSCVSP